MRFDNFFKYSSITTAGHHKYRNIIDFTKVIGHNDHNKLGRRTAVNQQALSVAEAKKHFSDLIGRVAYGKEEIVIMKRG